MRWNGSRSGEERLSEIEKELADLESGVAHRAEELSRLREAACRQLEEKVVAELGKLNLAGCSFQVSLARKEESVGGDQSRRSALQN